MSDPVSLAEVTVCIEQVQQRMTDWSTHMVQRAKETWDDSARKDDKIQDLESHIRILQDKLDRGAQGKHEDSQSPPKLQIITRKVMPRESRSIDSQLLQMALDLAVLRIDVTKSDQNWSKMEDRCRNAADTAALLDDREMGARCDFWRGTALWSQGKQELATNAFDAAKSCPRVYEEERQKWEVDKEERQKWQVYKEERKKWQVDKRKVVNESPALPAVASIWDIPMMSAFPGTPLIPLTAGPWANLLTTFLPLRRSSVSSPKSMPPMRELATDWHGDESTPSDRQERKGSATRRSSITWDPSLSARAPHSGQSNRAYSRPRTGSWPSQRVDHTPRSTAFSPRLESHLEVSEPSVDGEN